MEKGPGCITSYLPSFFSSDEIEVSDILLEVSSLIWRERLRALRWASKRRRSVLKESRFHYSFPIASPSLPSLLQDESEFERKTTHELLKDEAAAAAEVAAVTTSPTSALSFSPSQCDERKPELKLTFKKQQSNHQRGIKLEPSKLEVDDGLSLTLGMTLAQHFDTSVFTNTTTNQQCLQIQDVLDDNLEDPYRQALLLLPSSEGLGRVSNTSSNTGGSYSLSDPNVLSEEDIEMVTFQPLDMIRVLENSKIEAANARRNRISIIKHKKKLVRF